MKIYISAVLVVLSASFNTYSQDQPMLDSCPSTFKERHNEGAISCACPPNASGRIWGTGVYTDDSNICSAAIHFDIISGEAGGLVVVEPRPGQSEYEGTLRNGIESRDFGTWGGSFAFVGADSKKSGWKVVSQSQEHSGFSQVLADSAGSLCSGLPVECTNALSATVKAWFDEVMEQSMEAQSASRRFGMLFSNPGALADDTIRLEIFEEALNNNEFAGELSAKLNNEFLATENIGLPKMDAKATKSIASDIAINLITDLAIESLSQYYEQTGDKENAYWIRTTLKPSIEIGALAKGLALGTATASGAAVGAGMVWGKNIYSFALLGARLNEDDATSRDVNSMLSMLAEQNESIVESLMSGKTRGVLYRGYQTRELTQKELNILQDMLRVNYEHQTELLKQKAMYDDFAWVVDSAKKFATLISGIEAGGTYSGLEHANSTPSLPEEVALSTASESVTALADLPKPLSGKALDWESNPEVAEILQKIVTSTTPEKGKDCADKYGPFSGKDLSVILSQTNIEMVDSAGRKKYYTIGDFSITDSGVLCPENPASCGRVFYCSSGESVLIYGGGYLRESAITSVSFISATSVVGAKIEAGYYQSSDRTLKDQVSGCKIRTGWSEPTEMRWDGDCTEGYVNGPGTLTWYKDKDAISKIHVGPDWDVKLNSGELVHAIDFSQFEFRLKSCPIKAYRFREVYLAVPHAKSHQYFQNTQLVEKLLHQAAAFAVKTCESESAGTSNISVKIGFPNSKVGVVQARNYEKNELSWREITNDAESDLRISLDRQNRERSAAERMHAQELREEADREQLKADMVVLKDRGERFLETRIGTPEELLIALQIDEKRTIEMLEDGIEIDLQPTKGSRTVEYGGNKLYAVTYSPASLIDDLVRGKLNSRLQNNFSFVDWFEMIESVSSGLKGKLELTCLFPSASDIPQQPKRVSATLKSYNSQEKPTSLLLECDFGFLDKIRFR